MSCTSPLHEAMQSRRVSPSSCSTWADHTGEKPTYSCRNRVILPNITMAIVYLGAYEDNANTFAIGLLDQGLDGHESSHKSVQSRGNVNVPIMGRAGLVSEGVGSYPAAPPPTTRTVRSECDSGADFILGLGTGFSEASTPTKSSFSTTK